MSSRKVPLTFTFQRSGVDPPIFVAGTFSDPPWQPLEMDASIDQHGDIIFTKQVMVDECSDIQYKFRHASGDWWALDHGVDTTTDANGNVNSLLHSPTQHAAQDITMIRDINAHKARDTTPPHATEAPNDAEDSVAGAKTGSANTNTGMEALDSSPKEAAEKDESIHLSFAPIKEVINIPDEVPDSASQFDDDNDDDLEVDDGDFPLFSHECFSSASDSPEPSLTEHGLQDENDDHYSEKFVPSNTNYDDPRLETFPSDRDSIIATMRRLSASIDVDPTMLDVIPLSTITTSESSFAGGAPSPKLGFLGVGDPGSAAAHKQLEEVSQQQPASILSPSRSLQSIAEAEEAPDGNETRARAQDSGSPAQRIGPVVTRKLSLASAGSSGEDEGIAMAVAPRKRMREASRMKVANDRTAHHHCTPSIDKAVAAASGRQSTEESASVVSGAPKKHSSSSEQDDDDRSSRSPQKKPSTVAYLSSQGPLKRGP